jgi:hypothetical protein
LSGLGDRIRQQVTASLAAAGINMETSQVNAARGTRGARGPRTPAASEHTKPAAPSPSASAAEQMAILKMVEKGEITPEEAETLLKALGA